MMEYDGTGRDGWALGLLLSVSIGVMLLGGLFTFDGVRDWYPTLVKPPFTPPSWLFGPVWTVLYLAIAFSGWFLWRARRRSTAFPGAFALYVIQLSLNLLWSFLFFALRVPALALLNIILLWLAIVAYIIFSARLSRVAAALFAPYALWVGFATLLNFEIWRLNG